MAILLAAASLVAGEEEVRPPMAQPDIAILRAVVIERRHDADILRLAPAWIEAIRSQTPSSSVGIYVALELLTKYEALTVKEALELHAYLSRQHGDADSLMQHRLLRQWVGFIPAQAQPEQVADEMKRAGWNFDRARFLEILLAQRQEMTLTLDRQTVGQRNIIISHSSPFGEARAHLLPQTLTLGGGR